MQKSNPTHSQLSSVIKSLEKQVVSDRISQVKKKLEENRKLVEIINDIQECSSKKGYSKSSLNLLEKSKIDARNLVGVMGLSNRENTQQNAVRPITLTKVEKLPPYTTWVFLDRNRRMTEDQSAVKEELDDYEEKKVFVDSEDYILRLTIDKLGLSDAVLDALARRFCTTPYEVKMVIVCGFRAVSLDPYQPDGHGEAISSMFPYKDPYVTLDLYDDLFCRRCLVFCCKLHGCSQDHIFPAEKQLPWSSPDEESIPCGLHCYRQVLEPEDKATMPSPEGACSQILRRQSAGPTSKRRRPGQNASVPSNIGNVPQSSDLESRHVDNMSYSQPSLSPSMTKFVKKHGNSKQLAETFGEDDKQEDNKSCKDIEKALFQIGVEIFGRNSCLIARNLMNNMKTCSDVFQFMNRSENKLSSEASSVPDCLVEGCPKGDDNKIMDKLRRSKVLGRRRKVRRLKFTLKSSGNHSFRKLILGKKDEKINQYKPCGCKSACGKECVCYLNGTGCEKYCGCPRSCKIKFRGCLCAKCQCQSRQCPCFAANRECDPDVCRNCWISCGDGTLGVPSSRGENHKCENMNLLLKLPNKVLLARSDVSGWGAFLKENVEKNEYIGEYTGELISREEADMQSKHYWRTETIFMFDLNEQYCIDAFRMGSKLKFANHLPKPNCFAQILKVRGDHKVAIFANERLSAGEEIFYDYGFNDDQKPDWALDLESSTSRKNNRTTSLRGGASNKA